VLCPDRLPLAIGFRLAALAPSVGQANLALFAEVQPVVVAHVVHRTIKRTSEHDANAAGFEFALILKARGSVMSAALATS
jgi:hypothetical protein